MKTSILYSIITRNIIVGQGRSSYENEHVSELVQALKNCMFIYRDGRQKTITWNTSFWSVAEGPHISNIWWTLRMLNLVQKVNDKLEH